MNHNHVYWDTKPESVCAVCNLPYADYEVVAIAEAVEVLR